MVCLILLDLDIGYEYFLQKRIVPQWSLILISAMQRRIVRFSTVLRVDLGILQNNCIMYLFYTSCKEVYNFT